MRMKLSIFFFLLISLSSSSTDFQTLLSFKASSDHYNSLSSWSNSTHFCSWLGVTCNSNITRVTQLVLQNLNLTGSVQVLTQLKQLRLLSLKHNNFSSSSNLDFSSLQNLKLLYLSHNQFSGNFPSGVIQLLRLRRIDLSHNQFFGEIPLTPLTHLRHLLTLRLESNYFNGSLQTDTLKALEGFNVSDNNLSGEIPRPLSLFFPSSSFEGNENLCGEVLGKKCVKPTAKNDHPLPVEIPIGHGKKKLSGRAILVILLIDVTIVALLGLGIFLCCRMMKKRKESRGVEKKNVESKKRVVYDNEEIVFFEGCKRFKVDELLKSSAEMLGKGNVGTTYKVVMDNGDVVVVKRAKERRKKKEIGGLLKEIGGLRHHNIVSLRAFYGSRDELLLVYDYLPNGSLHSLLHGNSFSPLQPVFKKFTSILLYNVH
ncbi:hypothetical protein IFM89_015696 [Coptis chinensis]|uniref:Protein kinase domain-containing protein n=1 Tax=Coptis chinensis TaxID=261450 RepID=A0A835IEA1_9MAGN|nr:hypothetical protein IFM89_015696 [Coptis chinensis]